jgi:hypothetical protein
MTVGCINLDTDIDNCYSDILTVFHGYTIKISRQPIRSLNFDEFQRSQNALPWQLSNVVNDRVFYFGLGLDSTETVFT